MKKILIFYFSILCKIGLSQSVWINQILEFNQGLNNDSVEVNTLRSNPDNCLGIAQASDVYTIDSSSNFVALGFGGELVAIFRNPVKNIEGMDLKVHETTFGTPPCKRYPEKIMLFASQDGCNWIYLGEGCQDAEFDLGELNWAQYIKVIDISPRGNFDPFGTCDGYDIDAIEGYVADTNAIPTQLIPNSAQRVINFQQGLRKNGTAVTLSRSNPINSLGLPQGTDIVNFVSLGFGGQLTLKFDFVVFNNEGFDFQITETTYGNPECSQYPEKAVIEISLDGINWNSLGIVCLDAVIDMNPIPYFQYIRITDKSPKTMFSGTADGYDVDGVFLLSNCGLVKRVDFDDIVTMNEESEVTVLPNPFNDKLVINSKELKEVIIYNYTGSTVKRYKDVISDINTEELPKGIYYIEIISPTNRTTHKLVKN